MKIFKMHTVCFLNTCMNMFSEYMYEYVVCVYTKVLYSVSASVFEVCVYSIFFLFYLVILQLVMFLLFSKCPLTIHGFVICSI